MLLNFTCSTTSQHNFQCIWSYFLSSSSPLPWFCWGGPGALASEAVPWLSNGSRRSEEKRLGKKEEGEPPPPPRTRPWAKTIWGALSSKQSWRGGTHSHCLFSFIVYAKTLHCNLFLNECLTKGSIGRTFCYHFGGPLSLSLSLCISLLLLLLLLECQGKCRQSEHPSGREAHPDAPSLLYLSLSPLSLSLRFFSFSLWEAPQAL